MTDGAKADRPGSQPDDARGPRTTRQWVILAVAAVVLAALCLVAGRWQWNRSEARNAEIDLINANWSAPAVPVEEVLDGPGAVVPATEVWQPVELEGRYVTDATVLLRNRPVGGRGGYHVLVPFEAQLSGQDIVIVVDRGFVPLGSDASSPDAVPAPPPGTVTVVASLRADEPASSRGSPPGQVQAISTAQVLAAGPDGAAWAERPHRRRVRRAAVGGAGSRDAARRPAQAGHRPRLAPVVRVPVVHLRDRRDRRVHPAVAPRARRAARRERIGGRPAAGLGRGVRRRRHTRAHAGPRSPSDRGGRGRRPHRVPAALSARAPVGRAAAAGRGLRDMRGRGDYRSAECVALRRRCLRRATHSADVVVPRAATGGLNQRVGSNDGS